MRDRFITVPKNQKGIEEYNVGVESSNNLHSVMLPEKEFRFLLPAFSAINNALGLLIDDFESEVINNEHLEKCKEIIEGLKIDSPVFGNALEEAIKYKTIIALDF